MRVSYHDLDSFSRMYFGVVGTFSLPLFDRFRNNPNPQAGHLVPLSVVKSVGRDSYLDIFIRYDHTLGNL